jgi:hypothetical protein
MLDEGTGDRSALDSTTRSRGIGAQFETEVGSDATVWASPCCRGTWSEG